MHQRGVRGARFNLVQGPNYDLDSIRRTANRISDLGWHLELYVQGERLAALHSELERMPSGSSSTTWDRLRWTRRSGRQVSALRRLLDSGNVWVKLIGYRLSVAGFPYEDVVRLARLLVSQYSNRCLWGTDWPNVNFEGRAPTPDDLFAALARWTPSDRERMAILVDNPCEVYDLRS